MKKQYLFLAVGLFIFGACQKDEISEENLEIEDKPVEYFTASIDDREFDAKDPELIGGYAYPSQDSGIINFDFSADVYDGEDFIQSLNFKVCFYDGPGTYETGTKKTVSWAFYWFGDGYWENHWMYGNPPGQVIVTKADDSFVEGTFEFEAYNEETENTIHVKGKFGVLLEKPEHWY